MRTFAAGKYFYFSSLLKIEARILLVMLLITLFGLDLHIELANRLTHGVSVEQAENMLGFENELEGGAGEMEGDGPDNGQNEKPLFPVLAGTSGLSGENDFRYLIALYQPPCTSCGTLPARLLARYERPAFFILYLAFKDDLLV